jgi:hypothetical protein
MSAEVAHRGLHSRSVHGAFRASGSADRTVAAFAVAQLAVLSFLLLSPGRTYTGMYVHDLMVFFDGAHRVLSGQTPNSDFHTPLGPLAYLFPALGLSLGGALGRMMPVATVVFAAVITPILIYVSTSRLKAPLAFLFSLYVLFLVMAPLNPGDDWRHVSFAMFYNRFGWAALSILFARSMCCRRASCC